MKLIKTWLSRACVMCGRHKPLFTAYCDDCSERHL